MTTQTQNRFARLGSKAATAAGAPDPHTIVEPGAAFVRLAGLDGVAASRERFDVIVIGGGQAGLSVGYHLQRQGVRFVILDAQRAHR